MLFYIYIYQARIFFGGGGVSSFSLRLPLLEDSLYLAKKTQSISLILQ